MEILICKGMNGIEHQIYMILEAMSFQNLPFFFFINAIIDLSGEGDVITTSLTSVGKDKTFPPSFVIYKLSERERLRKSEINFHKTAMLQPTYKQILIIIFDQSFTGNISL